MDSKLSNRSVARLLDHRFAVFRRQCVAVNLLLMLLLIVCGLHELNPQEQEIGSRSDFLHWSFSRRADMQAGLLTTIFSQLARLKCCLRGIVVGVALRGHPNVKISLTWGQPRRAAPTMILESGYGFR